MNDATLEAWSEWLRSFRASFVAAKGWSEKDAKRRIRDAWVVVRDGEIHDLTSDTQRPADAVPVFEILTLGGWMRPLEITDRLTGLVRQAMSSDRSPRDIVLGLLDLAIHADGPADDETKKMRQYVACCVWQVLDACEDKSLAEAVKTDAFWQAVLWAFQAGSRHTILELHQDPQLMADLIKAQAFQGGRGADEVSRRLEASYDEQRAKLGCEPSNHDVIKAAGGAWSKLDECWQFDGLKGLPDVTRRGICERLKDIRRKHRRGAK